VPIGARMQFMKLLSIILMAGAIAPAFAGEEITSPVLRAHREASGKRDAAVVRGKSTNYCVDPSAFLAIQKAAADERKAEPFNARKWFEQSQALEEYISRQQEHAVNDIILLNELKVELVTRVRPGSGDFVLELRGGGSCIVNAQLYHTMLGIDHTLSKRASGECVVGITKFELVSISPDWEPCIEKFKSAKSQKQGKPEAGVNDADATSVKQSE
jgi:hypothetical protein